MYSHSKKEVMETKVIFRKWKDSGEIIAIFPESIDKRTLNVSSYEHIGQHADIDYNSIISSTIIAKEEEYKYLLSELKHIGYENIRILKRFNRNK